MKNKVFFIKTFTVILMLFTGILAVAKNPKFQQHLTIDKMPLVQDDPFYAMSSNLAPIANRGPEFKQWLEPGVRIAVTGARGSGTIIYYDEKSGYGYIQSCGHLWSGNMTAEEGKRRNITCTVDVFYQNGQRLEKPKTFKAEVLFYSNNKGSDCQDVSLLRFKPDFKPSFFPIAPSDTKLQTDEYLNSIGCDNATEVAHYKVRVIGERGSNWPDLVTTENSPRPGRSGGGLISNQKVFVGVCWGTSNYDGSGNGFFTPLRTIRIFNEKEGYGWLNEINKLNPARMIPIKDRNNPQINYPDTYIPLPNAA